jgi:Tol biopolymer transport system component
MRLATSSLFALSLLSVAASCAGPKGLHSRSSGPPLRGGVRADELIQQGERHFARLWKLTAGGENAEGYWSFAGDRLSLQRRNAAEGIECDRIYVSDRDTGDLIQVSNGRGVTTCAHFLPGDREVLFASTHASSDACPPPPDRSRGYVWALHPEYEIYVKDLDRGVVTRLTDSPGYDAEATVSPRGDRIVFTSTRSGDVELWTSNLAGGDLVQVTDSVGYDGGAFFSHDGKKLVFRATEFSAENREHEVAEYQALLAENYVRPSNMELYTIDPDGSNRRQLTHLGGANWAPYFTPDDRGVIFCTNHHADSPREFDLFLLDIESGALEQVTTYVGFDSFPMFSPDGHWLLFASNRGGDTPGETNLFLAEWVD